VPTRHRQQVDLSLDATSHHQQEKKEKDLVLSRPGPYPRLAVENAAESLRREIRPLTATRA
jgi:hypothetical protein